MCSRTRGSPAKRSAGAADVSVEVAVIGRPGAKPTARGGLVASKRFKLNGVPKRASDVVGAITAVLFTTDDMELVKGAPSGRRRYLDVMLSQVDHHYLRALQRYTKVITQRNALLKRIQDGAARPAELAYWDGDCLATAPRSSRRAPPPSRNSPAMPPPRTPASVASANCSRLPTSRASPTPGRRPRMIEAGPEAVAAALLDKLHTTHPRDIAAGVTLTGPHRDDLSMTLGGEPASSFASRGQQRTAALAAPGRSAAAPRAQRRAPDPPPRRRPLRTRRVPPRQRPRRHRRRSGLDHQPRSRPLRRRLRRDRADLAHRQRPRGTRTTTCRCRVRRGC